MEAREQLNTKAIGIKGAKESLKARLQKLENEEKALPKTTRPQQVPKAPSATTGTPIAELQKKVPKRAHEKPAEEVETEGWVEIPK